MRFQHASVGSEQLGVLTDFVYALTTLLISMRRKLRFITDKQQLARAGRNLPPLPPVTAGDKVRLNQIALTARLLREKAQIDPFTVGRGTIRTPEGHTIVITTNQAVSRRLQEITFASGGPGNRVNAARKMIGTPYKQQFGNALRTGNTPEALEYMDCSEFVARVLAADGLTKGVLNMNAEAIKSLLSQRDKYVHSLTPQPGDIALWSGHVGIVSAVDADGKFRMIHASGAGRPALENKFFTTAGKYRSGTFYGYYRPIGESGRIELPKRRPQVAVNEAKSDTHPTASNTTGRTKASHQGQRSNDDGTFPLPEVTVVSSPGQSNLPQNPSILTPKIKLSPNDNLLPTVLPNK